MSMNSRKLDQTGLSQVWSKIVENFTAKTIAEEIKRKLETVSENAQVNVIESVSVNNVELEVTEKGININVPTGTLAGLDEVGISQLNAALRTLIDGKADKADVYTRLEVDNAISRAVAGVYKFKGSVAFAELPTEGMQEGDTYNIKDDFVTTEVFVEAAGKEYTAGTNISWTENGWDCLAGIYDFSEFIMKSDLVDITAEEINAICVMPELN